MAVTARFIADFSSFTAAVQKAEVGLKEFESDSHKVASALEKMTDRFSGRSLIQEALLMEKAIANVGGISVLTGKELEKAGAKAAEAIEIMKRGGRDVPPGLQKIADGVKVADKGFGSMIGTISRFAGALGIGMSVGAVVSFGKAIFADADALTKMSDKTGIGVEGLQRLRVAGDDAAVTLEQMTGGINMMQRRLAGGDSSLLKAFRDLGLSVESIRAMAPDKQFMAIGDAIRGIKDPADQVNAAMQVFGRSGAELLPVIQRGFKDVNDAGNIMSADAVKALDDTGDAIERLWRRTKGAIGEAVGQAIITSRTANQPGVGLTPIGSMLAGERRAEQEQQLMLDTLNVMSQFQHMTGSLQSALGPGGIPQILMPDDAVASFIRATDLERDRLNALREAAKRAGEDGAKAFDQMLTRFNDFEIGTPKATGKVLEFSAAVSRTVAPQIKQLGDGVNLLGLQFGRTSGHLDTANLGLQVMGPAVVMATADLKAFREETEALKAAEFAKQLNNVAGAFGAMGAVLDQVEGPFAEMGRIVANTGEQIASNLASGNMWGAVVAGITGVGTILNKVFGDAEQRKVNDMRDEFVAMSGGFGALNERARKAGFTLDRLLRVDNVKHYTREMERLQAAFDFQNDALDQLASAEEKYHLSLNKTSADLFTSYSLLMTGGRDAGTVVGAMKDDWIALVVEARKFGIALPASLKPILETLLSIGGLTDEDREKLGDLSDIRFDDAGASGKSAFDRMTESVDKLVAAIKLAAGLKLTDLENQLLGIEGKLRAIDNIFVNLPNRPTLSPSSAAALTGGGGGETVINLTTTLDGEVISENTTRHQNDKFSLTHKTRAA